MCVAGVSKRFAFVASSNLTTKHKKKVSPTHLLRFLCALERHCVRSWMGAMMECSSESCASVDVTMDVTSSVARCDLSSRLRSFLMRLDDSIARDGKK